MTTPSEPESTAGTHEQATDQLTLGLDEAAETIAHAAVAEEPAPPEPAPRDEASAHLFDPNHAVVAATPVLSLGARLRNAREAAGLGLDQVSRSLRIPSARLAEIERDHFDGIGASVYLRGYLRSYARLVGLPEVVVTAALDGAAIAQPKLVASQTVSRSHYFTSRYGSLLVYGVLTAVIVVPLLWAARQGSLLPEARAPLASLDAGGSEVVAPFTTPVVATAPAGEPADAFVGPPAPQPVPQPAPVVETPRPVMAAMAPIPDLSITEAPVAGNVRSIALSLAQPSWIELVRDDGKRVEYGLLPAGAERTYELAGGGNLRIGNTRGATLRIDGELVDLAPHTRANVARVDIATRPATDR